jgi:hypothetical protein
MNSQSNFSDLNKKNSNIGIILFIVLLAVIVFAAFYFANKYSQNKNSTKINVNDATLTNEISDISASPAASTNVNSQNDSIKCKSELTSGDKLAAKSWKTFNNSKYNYSFIYPETWVYSKDSEDDRIILTSDESSIDFQFRAGIMTSLGFEGFKTDSKKEMNIACEKANITYLSADTATDPSIDADKRIIIAQFTKNDTPFLITLSYKYIGASITGDILDAMDLIIKSVEFK